jgi:MFS family permease
MDAVTPATESPAPERERLITGPFISVTLTAFVFFFYIGMMIVTVPRLVEDELGHGEFGVGLTVASFAIAAIAARPFLGRLTERFGRRALMMSGALVAAAASVATGFASTLWMVIVCRSVMGLGEAALFVAAATLVADLSPSHRRAEAASYFSVAVYGGIGLGPTLGEWVLADDRYRATFIVAGAFAALAALTVLGVPKRVDRLSAPSASHGRPPLFHRAALRPGLVLASGIAGFSVFSAFLPEHSRAVGLSGSAGLFLVYSAVSLSLRIAGARLPERLGERVMVSIALSALMVSLLLIAAVGAPWALWAASAGTGVGMAFLYPSLMANVVNQATEHERASALSSFTMFFELGTIVGGVVLGAVGELFTKQAAFLGGAVVAAIGLVMLQRATGLAKVQAPNEIAFAES